jgi:hypothetical protein
MLHVIMLSIVFTEKHYADCSFLNIITQTVVLLNVALLNIVMLSVDILSVVTPNAKMLNAFM